MIDKATFEAHVRAEAEKKYPYSKGTTAFLPSVSEVETDLMRQAYIAARMENEWKLVEALQKLRRVFKVIDKEWALDWGPMNGACHRADAALSPPYTKPNHENLHRFKLEESARR